MSGEPIKLPNPAQPTNANLSAQLDKGNKDRQVMAWELEEVKQALAENTVMTRATAENTKDLVEFFTAFKGAFRVLEYIGKLAKPLGYIAAVGTAISGFWATFKGGR